MSEKGETAAVVVLSVALTTSSSLSHEALSARGYRRWHSLCISPDIVPERRSNAGRTMRVRAYVRTYFVHGDADAIQDRIRAEKLPARYSLALTRARALRSIRPATKRSRKGTSRGNVEHAPAPLSFLVSRSIARKFASS